MSAQLREQIADALHEWHRHYFTDEYDFRGSMTSMASAVLPIVLAQVEAAKATARRDALNEAADEMFNEVEGGPGLLRPEVQDWLRWRAATDER